MNENPQHARLRFTVRGAPPLQRIVAALAAIDEAYTAFTGFDAAMWMTANLAARPQFAQAMVIRGGRRARRYTPRELVLYREMALHAGGDLGPMPAAATLRLGRADVVGGGAAGGGGFWEVHGDLRVLTRIRDCMAGGGADAALAEIDAPERRGSAAPETFDLAAGVLGLEDARRRASDALAGLGGALDPGAGVSAVPELLGAAE